MKNALLLSLSVLALTAPALAQNTKNSDTAAKASVEEMDMTQAENESQYRMNLMALGSMSLQASEIAESRASNGEVKKFAAYEVAEQSAISSVLKDMKTTMPPMSAQNMAVLDQLKSASGADFDRAYLQASLDTHEKLEDLGENYLNQKAGNAAEQHAHHLATVTLPTIKQHIAQSRELINMVK